jgi:hypothetical protein
MAQLGKNDIHSSKYLFFKFIKIAVEQTIFEYYFSSLAAENKAPVMAHKSLHV